MAHYTLIVEDHPLYREGLGDTLSVLLTDTVVLKASSAEEGLMLTDHLQDVRLICLDLGLPNLQGIDAVSIFRSKFPKAVLIVVSGADEQGLQKLAVERGADAFIPKSASAHEISAVVHRSMAGDWLAPRLDLAVAGADDGRASPLLTTRQSEVLQLLDMGFSNKQIAKRLDVAEVTVKLHVSGIFRAFGVNCRSKALLIARKSGLLSSA
jgi:two-component system nitrate/nitrite response regulator NarL